MTRKEVIIQMHLHGSKMSRISLAYIEWGRGDIKADDLRLLKQVFDVEYDVCNNLFDAFQKKNKFTFLIGAYDNFYGCFIQKNV